ncbi:MAG: alpha/beta hydrolase [Pseudomonadales bacterium]|nr:alpha/beta hydrolase [Pseudomonadales bacterium]
MQGQPTEHRFDTGQVRLAWFEWGRPGDPVVLLVHATGFHARCWDRTVAALPPGFRVIALDMRGHGRSDKTPPYGWESFGADLESFVAALGIRDAIGVGHSMGGHCVTHVAGRAPGTFARLLLVDPVIMDPALYGAHRHQGFERAEDHPVARRRDRWSSWEEMYARFAERLPFSRWRPAVLENYCRFGLLPDPAGDGWQLACPGVVEASIYLGSGRTDIYGLIPAIRVPAVVLRAPGREPGDTLMDFSKSPTWPGLAQAFQRGRDVFLPDHTHFIPMEDPDLVARFIVDPDAEA